MSYWKVQVDCYKQGKTKRSRVRTAFLVEAVDMEEAKTKALEVAEVTAAFGPKWVGFEWRSVCPIEFPLEVNP